MKLSAYTRVSTADQVDGFGLIDQRATIREWCKTNGHTISRGHSFTDEGVSGTLAERDGLADVLDAVRSGSVAGVVFPRLDRLARDVLVQEQLLAELWRLGAVVFSCSATEAGYLTNDPDDPSRKLVRQVLGAVNSYERDMIALRLRNGRRRKAAAGGHAYGSPSFGTRAEHGELVVDNTEQVAIRRARELRAEGRSLREIATALDDAGFTSKRGGPWHPQTIARVLDRADRAA